MSSTAFFTNKKFWITANMICLNHIRTLGGKCDAKVQNCLFFFLSFKTLDLHAKPNLVYCLTASVFWIRISFTTFIKKYDKTSTKLTRNHWSIILHVALSPQAKEGKLTTITWDLAMAPLGVCSNAEQRFEKVAGWGFGAKPCTVYLQFVHKKLLNFSDTVTNICRN